MSDVSSVAEHSRSIGLIGRMLALVGQRGIDRVGARTSIAGRPHVVNDGFIQIGQDCHFSSHPIQSHLLVMPGATITIGDRVYISYGAGMSAMLSIDIGDDTRIGPFCMILDNDFHKVGDRDSAGLAAAVQIGRGVTIGARVTLLRGARIGDGAQIMSGSTVSGVVASGAVIAGVPGKNPLSKSSSAVAAIVMRVFGLATLPGSQDGPAQIPGWTPRGAMRLLVALEDTLGITLQEEQVGSAANVADLSRFVMQALAQKAHRAGLQRPSIAI
jgi:acetyltransferase-like isoleucine patch superfamily enzyme